MNPRRQLEQREDVLKTYLPDHVMSSNKDTQRLDLLLSDLVNTITDC